LIGLGLILLILGFVLGVSILWTIGIILLIVGVILAVLGSMDRAVGVEGTITDPRNWVGSERE
jgi:hypothetical protein